ncbi:MAG: DsbE family thiol:disulfide interchange protein [Hyphomonadaceae bacterium]
MKRWLAFAPLAALLIVVAVSVFLLTRPGERASFTEGEMGRPAPEFVLERLGGGEPVSKSERMGRAYLVNVFASWCTPCRAEHPQLTALHDAGIEIVGIAYKDQPENTGRFLDQLGNPFSAVGMDPEGRLALDLGITAVPETFVVGPDGNIRAVHRGPLTQEVVQELILPALNAP